MRAALALPVLTVPVQAHAAETGEVGMSILGYREKSRMKVTEPVLWAVVPFAGDWVLRASAAVDIVSGASPRLVTNQSGVPVQSISGASVSDRRRAGDVRLERRIGDVTLAASRAVSSEEDYWSRAFGVEARWELAGRATTLVASYGKSNDRVGSTDNAALDERRDTREYLVGVTQVLSPLAVVESNLQSSRGRGWYNDPYKFTLTFYPGASLPAFSADLRPDSRDYIAWRSRLRLHVPARSATLQADYRFFRDDWGIRSHTLEVGWSQDMAEGWTMRPALRWYSQSAADFYSPVIPKPVPAHQSSDQRLAAFGGLSPSARLSWRNATGLAVEGTVGYYYNARNLKAGSGSPEFETLRAAYVLLSIAREF
jgi:hypothetical protein